VAGAGGGLPWEPGRTETLGSGHVHRRFRSLQDSVGWSAQTALADRTPRLADMNRTPHLAGQEKTPLCGSELSTALRTGARVVGSRGVLAGRGFHVKRTGTVWPVCRRGEWRVASHETRAHSMAVRRQQGVRVTVSRETSVPARPDCSQGVGRAVELTDTGHGVLGTLQTRTRLHGVGSNP